MRSSFKESKSRMAEIGKSKLIDLILSDEKQFGQMWRKNSIFPTVSRDQMESILCILTKQQLKNVVDSCNLVKSNKEIATAMTMAPTSFKGLGAAICFASLAGASSPAAAAAAHETKSSAPSTTMSEESDGEREPSDAEDLEDTREADEAEGDDESDEDYQEEDGVVDDEDD